MGLSPVLSQSPTIPTKMSTAQMVPLKESLCADPVYGSVYQTLFQGGSWYDADQVYWRIRYESMAEELGALLISKPTKATKEKAMTLLGDLQAASAQMPSYKDIATSLAQIEQVVKAWAPPPSSGPKSTKQSKNAFDVLGDEQEE